MSEFLGYLVLGVILGMTYGIVALGIVLIYKGSRTLNFAQPYIGLACAFLCWYFTFKVDTGPVFVRWLRYVLLFEAGTRPRFVVAALLSLALAGLAGLAIERDVMRRLEHAPRLVTLIASIALANGFLGFVLLLFSRNDTQASELKRLPALLPMGWNIRIGVLTITSAHLLALIVVPLIGVAAAAFFKLTKFGVAIRATADNRDSAQLLGISAHKVSRFTWVAGSVLAGVAALLIVPIRGSLDPASLSTGLLVRSFAAALVGGLTSLPGAIVGGLVVGIGEALVSWQTGNKPGTPEIFLFLLMIVALLVRSAFGKREEADEGVAFIPSVRDLPARLQRHPVTRRVRSVALAATLMMVAAASLYAGPVTNGTLTTVAIFAIIGVSLTVLIGYAGQVSLGHFALVGVGAMAASRMYEYASVPFFVMLPLVVVVGMVVSLVIGLPALRIKGLYLAIVTIAFNVAAETYIFKHRFIARGSAGLDLTPPKLGLLDLGSDSNRPMFFFTLACFLLCAFVAHNLKRTRTGRGFFALRENEKAAATLGVGLTRYRLLAFMVSGGMAALAGALYGLRLEHVSALSFPTERSLLLVSMVIIGGLGSITGAALGSFVVVGLPLLLSFINPWFVLIATAALLINVITRAPAGLAGIVMAVRDPVIEGMVREATPPPAPQVQDPLAAPVAARPPSRV